MSSPPSPGKTTEHIVDVNDTNKNNSDIDERDIKDQEGHLRSSEFNTRADLPQEKDASKTQKIPRQKSSTIDCDGLKKNKFRPLVFLEFAIYFLLSKWLGPLSCILFIWKKEGRALAKNLHIYGGWRELLRIVFWLIRIYCFVLTFVLDDYESESQFWLVIYTDISRAVLYGAYYSSFMETEIKKFRTKSYDPGSNIIKKLVELVKQEKTKAFERRVMITRFPQIDVNNFYFIFPQRYRYVIPQFLEPIHISETGETMKKTMIKDGFLVRAEKFAAYVIDKAGYQSIDKIVIIVKIISRVIVLVRVLLPIGSNILDNLDRLDEVPNTPTLVLYIIQQFFYCFFIYKFAQIYDVLFLGLVLYYRKFVLLKKLKETIDVRPTTPFKALLKIIPAVPRNAENWLNLRRVMAHMNNQAFIVIDTNMSFALFYSLIFIAVYALYTVNLIQDLLDPISRFLSKNPVLQTTIFFTLVVIVIVLAIHLVVGILINGLFSAEIKEWNSHLSIVRSLEQSQEIYDSWFEEEHKTIEDFEEGDEFVERVDDIKSLLCDNFHKNLEEYLKKLKNTITIVIDGIKFEEAYNAHTLLGLKTTPQLFSLIITFISAVGLSTINDIINKANPPSSD